MPQAIDPRTDERGQSVVEFIVIVPIVAMLLLIMLEFGLAFNHRLTVGYATREGARIGAALAHGGATSCAVSDPALVDQQVIAATQRILKSPGSPIVMSDVNQIRIYKSDSNGNQIGSLVNVWTYTPGAGPDI
ncbi:MAG: TadE family protein, partial [Candidatus Limnocylindrales bacterium]